MPQSILIRTALSPQALELFLETIFGVFPDIDEAIQYHPDDGFEECYSQEQLEKQYSISFKSQSSVVLWMQSKPRDIVAVQKLVQIIFYYIGAANCLIIDGEEGPYSFWTLAKRPDRMLAINESIKEFVDGFPKG